MNNFEETSKQFELLTKLSEKLGCVILFPSHGHKNYQKKLTQVINILNELEITTQQGERLYYYNVDYKIGNEYSSNKEEIAKKILSKLGINEVKK